VPVAAAPAPAVVAPTVAALRPVSTVEPNFPRDGLGLGGRTVNLQARLTVDANGIVTAVNFVPSSAGTRAFERSARVALLQWRFPAGAGERLYTQQLRFSEE
jgi:outer membrane biosynthesis protein TonB